jgi:outer membrane receptor protein involved in Fe transport
VINIVSADVTRNSFRVSAEGGSWGSYNSSVGVTRRLGDHGLQLTLAHGASDGHVPQTDFTSTRVQGGWDWKISQTWRLSFRGRYTPFRFDDPSRTDDRAGFGAWGDIRRGMGQMLLKNESGGLSGSTQLYLNAGHHKFEDGFVSDDRIYGLSSYQQWRAGRRLSVAAGTDLISYGGITNVNDTEYTLNTFGLYALGMFSPLDLLHIRAGLRFQHNDIGLNTFAPSAGLSVTPIAGVRVFANMQSGFRHPTPRELYLFPPANAELQEERSIGYEVGLEYLIAQGSIRAAWFRTDATNLIATVANPAPPPPMRNLNIRDVEINGLEFTARYRLLPFLFAQLSWNKLDAGDYTAYNPSQQLKYMLHLSYRSFGASVAGQYIHELFAGDRGSLPLPDYHLMDVVLTWQSPWKLELYMKARNILDREYYVLPGYVAPGRHFFGGFRYLLH